MPTRLFGDACLEGALDGVASQVVCGGVAASAEQRFGVGESHVGLSLKVSAVHA